eukprot:6201280-Pleurochrysis_carterae.AAC.6
MASAEARSVDSDPPRHGLPGRKARQGWLSRERVKESTGMGLRDRNKARGLPNGSGSGVNQGCKPAEVVGNHTKASLEAPKASTCTRVK